MLWIISQFLIFDQKKIEKYRFVDAVLKMNWIIIQNANFFFVNDSFEQFIECMMIFFVNLFFNYDQIFLIETFRNLIAFQISIDLIQITIFFKKTINFVMQFVKIIIQILMNYISRITFFFDNVNVKKFQNIFENHKKILFEIWKKIFEHVQWLNEILTDFKKTDCTIFEKKSQFYCINIWIVEFIYDNKKKHSNIVKIIKIVKWLICTNVAETREFIEMCVYYRVFIKKFVIIFVSIYKLLKKNCDF